MDGCLISESSLSSDTFQYSPVVSIYGDETVRPPSLEVAEQPSKHSHRFRYATEAVDGSHGVLEGENSKKQQIGGEARQAKPKKTYPSVKIWNYKGPANVRVTLVTDTDPPLFHVHYLAQIKEKEKKGVQKQSNRDLPPPNPRSGNPIWQEVEVDLKTMVASFNKLSIIKCTTDECKIILLKRLMTDNHLDPTRCLRESTNGKKHTFIIVCAEHGEEKCQNPDCKKMIDWISKHHEQKLKEFKNYEDTVRLFFEAILPDNTKLTTISTAVNSKQSPGSFHIVEISTCCARSTGGNMIILCSKMSKIKKDTLHICYYEPKEGGWEKSVSCKRIHENCALSHEIPAYTGQSTEREICVYICIKYVDNSGNKLVSDPVEFKYIQGEWDEPQRKRKRSGNSDFQYYSPSYNVNGVFPGQPSNQHSHSFPSVNDLHFHERENFMASSVLQQVANISTSVSCALSPEVGNSSHFSNIDAGLPSESASEQHEDHLAMAVQQSGLNHENINYGQGLENLDTRFLDYLLGEVDDEYEDVVTDNIASVHDTCRRLDNMNVVRQETLPSLSENAESTTLNDSSTQEVKKPETDLKQHTISFDNWEKGINKNGNNLLHHSVILGSADMAKRLLDCTSAKNIVNALNNKRQTPLYLALLNNQLKIAEILLRAHASLSVVDKLGNSCFHLAAKQANHKAMELLKQFYCKNSGLEPVGATGTPDIKNYDGYAAVHLAVFSGSLSCIKYLHAAGADLLIGNGTTGHTALHYAVEMDRTDIVKYLLEENVSSNVTLWNGDTPLHLAAAKNSYQIAALLMSYGADPNIRNSTCRNADAKDAEQASDSEDEYSDISEEENNDDLQDGGGDVEHEILHICSEAELGETPRDLTEDVRMLQILSGDYETYR